MNVLTLIALFITSLANTIIMQFQNNAKSLKKRIHVGTVQNYARGTEFSDNIQKCTTRNEFMIRSNTNQIDSLDKNLIKMINF